VGIPVNFGKQSVDVTLSNDGMSFKTGNIKQQFGKDLLVTRIGVNVASKSDMVGSSTVSIEIEGEYKKSKIALVGRVVPGKAWLVPRKGSWSDAFGAKNVNLSQATFELDTDPSTLYKCPGPCGVKTMKVLGKAEVLLQTEAITGQAQGSIDMEHPEKSSLLIRDDRANADAVHFTVAHAGHPSQVQVALPLSKAALKQTADVAAEAHHHHETCEMLLELDSRLHEKQRAVTVQSVAGGVLDTASKKPFEVHYNVDYFGKTRTTSIAYSLAQVLDTANKGKYAVRKGYGSCKDKQFVGQVGIFKSMDDAQAACDALKDCASVMWSEDHHQNYHNAWFCKDDMSQSMQPADGWTVASRTSTTQTLLSQTEATSLMQVGIASHLPTAISNAFKDHAAKYGFEFSPTVRNKHNSHWLDLEVTPTKEGAKAVKDAIKQATTDAVRDIALKVEATSSGSSEPLSRDAFEVKLAAVESSIRDQAAAVVQKATSTGEDISDLDLKKASFSTPAELQSAVKKAAAQVENDATTLDHSALKTIEARLNAATAPVKQCSSTLQQKLPQLESLSVSKIYLECLYGNKKCDSSLVKSPQIEVCLKGMGCKSGAAPRLEQMTAWIQSHAKALTTEMLENVLEFKTTEVALPKRVEGTAKEVTVGSHTSVVKFPSKLVQTKIRVRTPVGVQAAKLKAIQDEL
jgi:hypothetical protein